MFIPILDQRGLSGLWSIDRKRGGIIFNCFSVVTSMPVGGFDCYGEGTEKGPVKPVDDDCDEWEVFVPFGTTAFLHWLNQHEVVVLSTFDGPLEVAAEWLGGGAKCYRAWAILPNGDEMEIDGDEEPPLASQVIAAHWEAAYPTLNHVGKYVKYRSNDSKEY